MEYLSSLNEAQKAAVLKTEGPLLVLAGAGSGKTRVITYRILHLLEKGVLPQEILAVTFTNKAAREMRERVLTLGEEYPHIARIIQDSKPTVTTFHALGVSILREQHEALGTKRYFTIYDRADSVQAIKQSLEALGYGAKEFEPRKILSIISKAKGDAISWSDFGEKIRTPLEQITRDVWQKYDSILKENQAFDFDDLLFRTLSLLRAREDILRHYQERFTYIHVDEYQDTNRVQYEIARLLSAHSKNICVVGDVDQNIYSWRGADLNNILKFERHFEGAETVLLEENYRSTQTIIAASNDIIEKNAARIPKKVFTNNAEGERIALYAAYNEEEEAHYVAKEAQKLIKNGCTPQDIAILFRANFQSRALEDAFLHYNVPYQMLGTRFFERKEVKDVLSYIRLALNPESTGDLSRIINEPPRGIGKVTLLKLIEGKREFLSGKAAENVRVFEEIIERIRTTLKEKPLSQAVKEIVRISGIEAALKSGGEVEHERLLNVEELVSLSVRYDDLPPLDGAIALLENAALQSDQDNLDANGNGTQEGVKLMTVHAAKGLEFSYVFITGLEEGLFPHERFDEGVDEEEERRLFYVALTRAKKKVFLSYAGIRTVFGSQRINTPSSFIDDIHEDYIESANPTESGYEKTVYLD